jgi:nucleotide-binding universal stress UspA family protein
MITMWSLSMPQVAATLAATLVGYRAGLLTEGVLNGVIVLMLVTATLGPLITARSAVGLSVMEPNASADDSPAVRWGEAVVPKPLTIVVPVYNPNTERNLIEMATMLVRHESGQLVPLAITAAQTHMDTPELDNALTQNDKLLARATELGQEFGVTAKPLARIDDSIAQGISRASREQDADLIVMGWSRTSGFRARLFGNVINSVLWLSHCPVAVTRLLNPPSQIHRILVPIENLSPQAVRIVRFAEILAVANQAEVTLLHVCDRRTTPNRIAWIESQLSLLVSKVSPDSQSVIKVVPSDNVAATIVNMAEPFDLVVLRSFRRRLSIGELAISDVTTEVVQQLTCSVVLLGEPQRHHASSILDRQLGDASSVLL